MFTDSVGVLICLAVLDWQDAGATHSRRHACLTPCGLGWAQSRRACPASLVPVIVPVLVWHFGHVLLVMIGAEHTCLARDDRVAPQCGGLAAQSFWLWAGMPLALV